METTRDNSGMFLKGILFGALAGAVAGLLFAPKPGRELRGDIKEKADEARIALEKAVERAKELKKEADHQLAEVRSRFRHFLHEGERCADYSESEMEGEA